MMLILVTFHIVYTLNAAFADISRYPTRQNRRYRLPIDRDMPEMTVPEMIEYWGYPAEEHWVTTEDGYILGLHRIPHGREVDNKTTRKPVVYLQHGLTSSSSCWSFGPPEKSLAYILADQGYDVWMGNSRGNSYSRNHTHLDPSSQEFWDFGWQEGGLFDVTAGIDYALQKTNQTTLYYIGHSMGATQYLVMLSERPQYNKKITMGVLLAPPAYMTHGTSFIFDLARFADDIQILFHLFGFYEFLPHSEVITQLAHRFCGTDHPWSSELCLNAGLLILGFNPGQLNGSMIPTYLDHIPEGTSTRPFVHYAQLYLNGGFKAYDYGAEKNLEKYNQSSPPDYDLRNVVAPTAVFKGDADSLVSLVDVDLLVNSLPHVVLDHIVEENGWTHIDYILGMDADRLVYTYILQLFQASP